MPTHTVPVERRRSVGPSESAVVGRILFGAAGGAAVGMLLGALAFNSLAVAIFAGLAGAIGGMVGPARAAEGEPPPTWER
jgi:hypothetical protein